MPDHCEVAIRASRLSKRFRSGDSDLVVFEDLDLDVARGEQLALVGESGAGKSTLLHILGGLDQPTSGEVWFGAAELTRMSDAELARFRNLQIGFVWQIHYLLPEFTAWENVMMPLLIRGATQAEAAPLAKARLEEVGLAARATHRAGELSGGEQQRVVLARALVGSPKFLLADEPTGNLDSRTGERIVDLIRDLHRSHNLTSIFVTHNHSFAKRCDRILKMESGTLIAGHLGEEPGPCGESPQSHALPEEIRAVGRLPKAEREFRRGLVSDPVFPEGGNRYV